MSQNVQIVISNFPEKWLVAPSDIVPLKGSPLVFNQMNKFYFVQIIDFMVQWVTVIINFISAPCKLSPLINKAKNHLFSALAMAEFAALW